MDFLGIILGSFFLCLLFFEGPREDCGKIAAQVVKAYQDEMTQEVE